MYLHEKLEEYGKQGRYPMHMPGHKRQLCEETYAGDITEIEGFDNLHHSEDILKSDREKAALFYGAGEARYLVNGSTCGVLAAISAVTEYGDSIIIGRNSHKSAYHAIQLRGLRAEYVYPDASLYGEWSIDGPIPPEEVRRLLEMSDEVRRMPEMSEEVRRMPEMSEEVCRMPEMSDDVRRMPEMPEEVCRMPEMSEEVSGRPGMSEEVRKITEFSEKACPERGTQGDPKRRIRAVFLTSPTYEGVISDVRSIADICHAHGVPLIVDEAHGAHLKVMEVYGNPVQSRRGKKEEDCGASVVGETDTDVRGVESSVSGETSAVISGVSAEEAGADIVILGLHKTMPVLTQGALLAVSREAIREGRVSMKALDEYLGIYESSSPSYVLMGSISRCIHWLDGSYEMNGRKIRESVTAYQRLLEKTRKRLSSMKNFRLFPVSEGGGREEVVFDPGKIVISTKGTGMTGQELAKRLRKQYRIEIEMASADYIVAMISMFDTEEGMRSFAEAVLSCDADLPCDAALSADLPCDAALSADLPCDAVLSCDTDLPCGAVLSCDVAASADQSKKLRVPSAAWEAGRQADPGHRDVSGNILKKPPEEFPKAKAVMSIAEAVAFAGKNPQKVRETELSFLMDRKSAEETAVSVEFIYVYPPGIPIVAPGEIITKGVAKKIICDYNSGCVLIGCVGEKDNPAVRCMIFPNKSDREMNRKEDHV